MNNQYRLLVVDLDGTLVNARGEISDADRAAIAAVKGTGVTVALSTGRVIDACRSFIAELRLDGPHIFFDGALVYDVGKRQPVYSCPIDRETLEAAVAFAHRHDIYLELYAIDRYFVEEINWADRIHREFFGLESTVADFDDVLSRETIIKCELMIHNQKEEDKASQLLDHFKGRLRGSMAHTPAYPEVRFVNVVDPAVSKGTALEKLARHFGIGLEHVIAIGDGANDIPLLEKAGLAVAMGNAKDEAKAVADHVTKTVDESGVAAAVEFFILGTKNGTGYRRHP